ncbi:RNA exonuclease 1 homolog [Thunnus maccoyii]|uniref:RNA exonuclease 1 homolog n=1 Tax=Thunnus maccoyii TaxID=8240 RepID=UPI001C4AC0E9|nr:RNA exonuclease 1 homolog [Thunnus maccoyii]
MFPSSGLFADIACPSLKRGPCERPHCWYKHATNVRDMFGASYKSSIVDFAGAQNGYPSVCGAQVTDEIKEVCLQELERINKEIETVKHEVEQEQRRLSRYQTVQADGRKTAPNLSVSKSETAGKKIHRDTYGLPSRTDLTKTYSRARKYVVDNTKPRTDLEYDPLSNFSADLQSYSSSGKEQKVKNGQSLKRARNVVHSDQKKPVSHQAQRSQSPSPELLDDCNDDSILIIDIPPSPDRKRGRSQKAVYYVPDTTQDTVKELKGIQQEPILLDSPPLRRANAEVFKVTSPPAVDVNRVCSAENNQDPPNLYQNEDCEIIALDESVICGCLEDLGGDCQKSTCFQAAETEEVKSPEPATAGGHDHSWNNSEVIEEENTFCVELSQCELPCGVEKMNPQQPNHFPHKNSLLYKTASSYSPYKQHTKNAQKMERPTRYTVQKTLNEMPQRLGEAGIQHASPDSYLRQTEPASGSSQFQAQYVSAAPVSLHLTNKAESSSASTEQRLVRADNGEIIIIVSSSDDEEEELNYSDVELSDSDPMEECYRIFMEANNEEKGNEGQPEVSVGAIDVEKPEVNIKPQGLSGKKRMAHEAKHTEQPLAKSRPQPQVLVPLRGPAASGFASQPSITSKIQQVQQRTSMLTTSVKGSQAFGSSTCQRKQETQTVAAPPLPPPAHTSVNAQPVPVQNAYINYIPVGTAVLEVGNNLHLILPQGAFPLPVSSNSSPVTSVLTPISQVRTSPVTVKQTYHPQMYHPPAVMPVQRYRTAPPLLIPAPARKPSLTSGFASAHSSTANPTTPQAANATAKPVPTKRKVKQLCETAKDKVPHDVRQRYVNMFTEEFLKTTADVNDAFEKALAEEKTVYNRSVNKLKYLSVAVNALKKLKNQSAVAAKDENVTSQRSKGNIPLNLKKLRGNNDMALYESLKDYILTEEKLIESNYPVQHPEKPGCAALFADNKKGNTDPLKRICCRCGATYSVSQTGKHIRKEECNYHYGKGVENRVPGGVETRYSCCEGVMGAPGCQLFKLHVHDSISLDGFVATVPRRQSDRSCPGVYSVDCEMCYTIHGLELSRVTVVNSSLQVVYDTFIKPDNDVIDYNTRFSGISEEDVKGNHTSLREVQATLLSFINADTILIGHGLETDLCALKLLHGMVVDTSVVFPHRLGPPHKLTLNNLTAEYLRRIIQESVCGHDTAEDAAACMELMLWKVKEDGKLKK